MPLSCHVCQVGILRQEVGNFAYHKKAWKQLAWLSAEFKTMPIIYSSLIIIIHLIYTETEM